MALGNTPQLQQEVKRDSQAGKLLLKRSHTTGIRTPTPSADLATIIIIGDAYH